MLENRSLFAILITLDKKKEKRFQEAINFPLITVFTIAAVHRKFDIR